jgi:ATP-binding cassette subfamily F protein 3
VLVAHGVATPFDGDLDDYKNWLVTQKAGNIAPAPLLASEPVANNSYTQQKQERQARIVARRPLLKECSQIEAHLEKWNTEKLHIDARLNEPQLYENNDKTELQNLLKKQAELTQHIEEAELRWLTIHEELEALPEIS